MRVLLKAMLPLFAILAVPLAWGEASTTQPASQTPAAPWATKPVTAWPSILLTNRLMMADKSVGFSGSSSAVRLPNGVVVLMTAGHLLNGVAPADFEKGFKSWIAVAFPGASAGVRMTGIAMDTSKSLPFDALVLLPFSQHAMWPGTVLNARQEPLADGETVYLIGIPANGKGRQTVHKGVVIHRVQDHEIVYDAEGTFKTTGNSGAPIVDSAGRFVAVNVGHLVDQTVPGKMELTCIDAADLMQQIKLPAGMKPLVLSAATQPATTVKAGATTPSADSEMEAEKQLVLVQLMISHGVQPEMTAGMLQQIIDKYPKTSAATQARALLAKMQKH